MNEKITTRHLGRRAIIYIRQSSLIQVMENLESQRRQYALKDQALSYGFMQVDIIDEDLGRSGSGVMERPGFSKMVALVCEGEVGAIFCLEASRLARNGREWHHLIDLCSLVGTLIIDNEGIYDALVPNDRLLLGMKGTMSEFELNLLKQRSLEALRQKAKRGELRFCLPVGLCWSRHNKIELEPHKRVQEAIRLVFKKFEELGSARQTLLWFRQENIFLPRLEYAEFDLKIKWQLPIYKNILNIIQNPLYAGAYAFGKTEGRTKVVEGRARKTEGHRKPRSQWMVLIKNHHPGYINWEVFEKNQKILEENTRQRKEQGPKSARGGQALLTGLLRCGHCGRMLHVTYCGTRGSVARYYCRGAHINYGEKQCISFGSLRPDEAISSEVLKAVESEAIEAAFKAAEQILQQKKEHLQMLTLELEQARYDASLAARRNEAVDPANRLVASELETRWNQNLQHVRTIEEKLGELNSCQKDVSIPERETFLNLAQDLSSVWVAPNTDMRLKQRILRLLICEIVVTIDKEKHEIIFTLHWKGGCHSELKIIKNKTGCHRNSNSIEATEVIKQMALYSSDATIAATLNRLGLKTGIGNSWNKSRVRSVRNYHNISSPQDNQAKDRTVLTLEEAAKKLSVSNFTVRRLIKSKVITAHQVVLGAPWQIEQTELEKEAVKNIVKIVQGGKNIPRSLMSQHATPMLFNV